MENREWSRGLWNHWSIKICGSFFIVLSSLGFVGAQELPRKPTLPLVVAKKVAWAALTKCEEAGYHVSVAVVDQGGNLKILLRGDGAGPHTTDSSARKAYTSASLHQPTQHLAELITKIPTIQGLRDINEKILLLGGGLPIKIGEEIVGGIGVGGAPGAHLDETCAQAGLTEIYVFKHDK